MYDFRKQLELYSIGFLVLIALIYGGFRAYPLIAGPRIIIYSPKNDEVVASTTFKISGRVLRTKEITLQGRTINIDTNGNFSEILVPQYPYTIIVLTAKDAYEAKITKTLRVIPE
jgi:hypothetical protein